MTCIATVLVQRLFFIWRLSSNTTLFICTIALFHKMVIWHEHTFSALPWKCFNWHFVLTGHHSEVIVFLIWNPNALLTRLIEGKIYRGICRKHVTTCWMACLRDVWSTCAWVCITWSNSWAELPRWHRRETCGTVLGSITGWFPLDQHSWRLTCHVWLTEIEIELAYDCTDGASRGGHRHNLQLFPNGLEFSSRFSSVLYSVDDVIFFH